MLGLPAAKALTRYRLPGGAAVLGFISLPLFIPDIVLGISLLILLNAVGIPLSLMSVVLGHVADLRAVRDHRADVALRRLRQEPGRSLARSGRERAG